MQLCPHRANPAACPYCFRMRRAQTPSKAPSVPNAISPGRVMPIGEEVIRASQATARANITAPQAQQPVNGPHHEPAANGSPDRQDPEKLWQPPKHPSIIDRLPRHPNADALSKPFTIK